MMMMFILTSKKTKQIKTKWLSTSTLASGSGFLLRQGPRRWLQPTPWLPHILNSETRPSQMIVAPRHRHLRRGYPFLLGYPYPLGYPFADYPNSADYPVSSCQEILSQELKMILSSIVFCQSWFGWEKSFLHWQFLSVIVEPVRPPQLFCISDIYLSAEQYKRHSRGIC